jgi:tetratricopeptide (TPR) repeat protein
MNRFIVLTLSLAALIITPSASFASGGGGGGFSSPSQSAPTIDPVEKYQEGVAALKIGENKKAEEAFRKVLKVVRKHPGANYLLGVSLFEQAKYKKARKPLEKSLKYDDSLVLARGYLAATYQRTKKADKAEIQKQTLLELQKTCGDCKDKASIETALKVANGASSTSETTSLLKSDSNAGDSHYLTAVGKINSGDYGSALVLLKESAQMFGPHPDILTYQGFVNRKLGNYAEALSFYTTALAILPEHRGANEYLGEYYVETGQMTLAKIQLKKLEDICEFGCEQAEELRRWISAAS